MNKDRAEWVATPQTIGADDARAQIEAVIAADKDTCS